VIPYLADARSYASGPAPPALSASLSSRKKPSSPAGETIVRNRPVRGTARRCPCGTPRGATDDGAGASRKLLLTDLEDVLALDHVEELVLVRVHVQRRVERIDLLDDRECAGRRLAGRLDEELGTRERQALALAGVEVVAACVRSCDGANLARAAEKRHRRRPGAGLFGR
jgi:hypothetical protein